MTLQYGWHHKICWFEISRRSGGCLWPSVPAVCFVQSMCANSGVIKHQNSTSSIPWCWGSSTAPQLQWQFAAKISTWEETFSASLLCCCFSQSMFGSTHPSVAISISLQLEALQKFVEGYHKATVLANPLLELFPYSIYLISQVTVALPLVRSIPSCSHTSLGCAPPFSHYNSFVFSLQPLPSFRRF